ncbi:hypothetical protein FRC06_001140 [Ceratobasidium sp. 370]|nr:hypothetical protein FRC06_001140 [Ceratobasidium sp. 370]
MSTSETAASGSVREPMELGFRDPVSRLSAAARNTLELCEPIQFESKKSLVELLQIGQEDTNKLLVEVREGLKGVSRVLIATQQSMARGLNRTFHRDKQMFFSFTHALLNAKGEDPHHLGLPSLLDFQYSLCYDGQVQDADIARYLRFYDLGGELIEEGDEPAIKEGKRDAAKAELKSYSGF